MTATLTPIPVENGAFVSVCVTTDTAGDWRTAWGFDGGRRKELFGPPYTLRQALNEAKRINEQVRS